MQNLQAASAARRAAEAPSADERIVLDARFFGCSGIGRMTELLLQGLREIDPPGRWVIWGPNSVRPHVWPGAEFVESTTPPMALGGQRELFRVPRGRYVGLNVIRPLVARRNTAIVVNDTIPIRFGSRQWLRPVKHLFFFVSAQMSSTLLVYSDATARRLRRDLLVGHRRIGRFDLGVDNRLVEIVRARRGPTVRSDQLLYVGLHLTHKNLARAIEGFRRSSFAATGATFTLVGASAETIEDLRRLATGPGPGVVEVLTRCSDDELADLYASATLVIQPSLEEGLGLTVIEALASGVPTCCTAGGALAEAACGAAVTFDGRDATSIAAAIDETVTMIPAGLWAQRFEQFELLRVQPTPREMAERFVALVGIVRS
jgi:glycosyltransferase involved in cell wall biosynthesis